MRLAGNDYTVRELGGAWPSPPVSGCRTWAPGISPASLWRAYRRRWLAP